MRVEGNEIGDGDMGINDYDDNDYDEITGDEIKIINFLVFTCLSVIQSFYENKMSFSFFLKKEKIANCWCEIIYACLI